MNVYLISSIIGQNDKLFFIFENNKTCNATFYQITFNYSYYIIIILKCNHLCTLDITTKLFLTTY